MRDYLEKLIQRKNEEIKDLKTRAKTSEDINEVRSIASQIESINGEIADAQAQLDKIDAENDTRSGHIVYSNESEVRAMAMASIGSGSPKQSIYESREYEEAFMNFVCRSNPIPAEFRSDEVTETSENGAVIPTKILNEIIKKMETYGNVYALVRKLNIQGGVAVPTLTLKPSATWIGEKTPSESKKLQTGSVTFSYFGIECKIAQTLLVNVVTLDEFQKQFVPIATEAIVKGIEIAIFNGNGTTQPLGILNDTKVAEANVIELTDDEFGSWAAWHSKVKAKIKKAYRNGTWFMNQATFDGQIDGMVDDNGQPIGRTNYGINGEETYRFMGKAVETVEDGCLPAFEDAEGGDEVIVYMNPRDYVINSNMKMTVVKWVDNDTNEVKNKCIMIVDGKLVDAAGVLIIKKKATT